MFPGWQQLLIVLVLVLILFGGRGRISSLMGDLAKGIKSFRQGLSEDDSEDAGRPKAGVTAALDEKDRKTVDAEDKETARSE